MQDDTITSDAEASKRRRWILFVVLLGQFMLVLDTSIVSVALRAIQADLQMATAQLAWVTSAYFIAFGGLLLFFGRLGDLIGRRTIFLAGMWIFSIASAACGLATSATGLIAARFVQGMGAAAASSVVLAIIAIEYPEAQGRTKAMSIYSLVSICGGSVGLLVGGLLTQTTRWHSIFLINVPVGLFAIHMGHAWLRREKTPGIDRTIDVAGAILVTTGAMSLIYALVASADHPFMSLDVLAPAIVAVAFLSALLVVESRHAAPLIPPRIVRIRSLMVSSVVRGFMVTAIYGAWFLGALELSHALGFGPLQVGLAFLPQTTVIAVLNSGISAKLINRFGARRVLLFGLSMIAVALFTMTQHTATEAYWPWRFSSYALMGVGAGCSFLPLIIIAMSEVPARDAGLGSAIVNVSLQMSAALGLAVLGSIAVYRTGQLHDLAATQALIEGFHMAYSVAIVGVLIGLVIAVLFLKKPKDVPAPAPSQLATE